MQNDNRLIQMNQFGDLIYVGPDAKGTYNGWGDFQEDLTPLMVDRIIKKLYYLEETLEYLEEAMDRCKTI